MNQNSMHSSLIAQFIALTAASPQEAQQILAATSGNLDLAIELYFDSRPANTLPNQQLQNALEVARQTGRKLLLFLMEPSSESSNQFLQQIWLNPQVEDILQQQGFLMHRIILNQSANASLPIQFPQSLAKVARVCVVDGEGAMEIDNIPLIQDTEEFIERVLGFLDRNTSLIALQLQAEEQRILEEDRLVEMAREASLAAQEADREQDEILKTSTLPPTVSKGHCKIQVRMPSGAARIEALFSKGDKVSKIFDFVRAEGNCARSFDLCFQGKRLWPVRELSIEEADLENCVLFYEPL